MKTNLTTFLGFTGSVNIYPIDYTVNPLPFVLNTNPNTTAIEIVYAQKSATFCPLIVNDTSTVSVSTFDSGINPVATFPYCAKDTELRDLFNFAIAQYRATDDYCQDQIDYYGYCKSIPPLFPSDETNDRCYNYKNTKEC